MVAMFILAINSIESQEVQDIFVGKHVYSCYDTSHNLYITHL